MMNEFAPDYKVPPGEIIKEELEWRFALELDYPIEFVQDLLAGKTPITEEVADRLERVLGPSAQFWLNLEANWRTAGRFVQSQITKCGKSEKHDYRTGGEMNNGTAT